MPVRLKPPSDAGEIISPSCASRLAWPHRLLLSCETPQPRGDRHVCGGRLNYCNPCVSCDPMRSRSPRRDAGLLVWIAVVVVLVAVIGPLGLLALPSSVYRQFAFPSSVHGQVASMYASIYGQVASTYGQVASLFSHDRHEAGASATLASPAPPPAPPPAATAPQRSPGLVASGYVIARRKATVAAQVTEKVVEVLVHEGMVVKKGDVLARLDSTLPARDLALARARADSAEAAIGATAADLQDAERIMNRNLRLPLGYAVTEAEVTRSQARVGVLRRATEAKPSHVRGCQTGCENTPLKCSINTRFVRRLTALTSRTRRSRAR